MDEDGLHPGHKSIRLKGHDYSAAACYFVTICVDGRRNAFGRIVGGGVELSLLGWIARENWLAIASHFANVNLHQSVVMPNHVHGIIEIAGRVGDREKSLMSETSANGAQLAAPLRAPALPAGKRGVEKGSLSAIVRSYKAAVTLRARRELGWRGEIWQRNYFERFLRDGREFADATRYIAENPSRWEWDGENPEARSASLNGSADGAQHAAPLRGDDWN